MGEIWFNKLNKSLQNEVPIEYFREAFITFEQLKLNEIVYIQLIEITFHDKISN